MDKKDERRAEQRLRYHWPIWFSEDLKEEVAQGQMVDVSSNGAAFTCHADEKCPREGEQVTARFSVPHFNSDEAFEMANFTRMGMVARVEQVNSFVRRVAVQFAETLPFRPGEQVEMNCKGRGLTEVMI